MVRGQARACILPQAIGAGLRARDRKGLATFALEWDLLALSTRVPSWFIAVSYMETMNAYLGSLPPAAKMQI